MGNLITEKKLHEQFVTLFHCYITLWVFLLSWNYFITLLESKCKDFFKCEQENRRLSHKLLDVCSYSRNLG